MRTHPSSTEVPPVEPSDAFASWVEWRSETCRNGRQLITAVNMQTGDAAYVSTTDLEVMGGDTEDSVVVRDLRFGGFLAGSGLRLTQTAPSTRRRGDGIVWANADRFVRGAYMGGLSHLFRRRGLAAQVALATLGAAAFVHAASTRVLHLRAEPAQIPIIVALGLVAVAIHEFGHAVVTVHHGRSVRAAGLRLHLGSPTFYVDSVDALLLTRQQRVAQAVAGPWAEWLVTSVAAIVLLALPEDSGLSVVLQRFVIINAFGIAMNLLPFVGLDGALILADLVREPDLQYRARAALRAPRSLATGDRWLVGYAVANSIVAGALLVTAVFFWWELFGTLIERLARSGATGVGVLIWLAAALIWHAVPLRVGVRNALAFRMERRWRVRAIKAFMQLPQIAPLDTSALGILAGHLKRMNTATIDSPVGCDHIYLERDRRLVLLSSVSGTQRAAVLPAEWQRFLPSVSA